MGVTITNKRRDGNTTRQADAAIQYLFNGYEVIVVDHASLFSNKANEFFFKFIMRRLFNEHGIDLKQIDFDREKLSIKLKICK